MIWLAIGLLAFCVFSILAAALSRVRAAVKARDEEWEKYIEARYGASEEKRRQ